MAITNGYLTLEELKAHLHGSGFPQQFTPQDESNMEIAIMAMSRLIDNMAGSNFYGSTETRYFTPVFGDLLDIDDLISLTTLKTDENQDGTYEYTWQSTDYWLEPRNARLNTDDGQKRPYRQIRVNPRGNYTFPLLDHSVEIVGSWGYTDTVPQPVKNMMLLAANRIFRRKDAIFGIAGAPQLGVQVVRAKIEQDSDIQNLLANGLSWRGL